MSSVKFEDLAGGGTALQFDNGITLTWEPPKKHEPFYLFIRDGASPVVLPVRSEQDANAVQQFVLMAMEAAREHIENQPDLPSESLHSKAREASELATWLGENVDNPEYAERMRELAIGLHLMAKVREGPPDPGRAPETDPYEDMDKRHDKDNPPGWDDEIPF